MPKTLGAVVPGPRYRYTTQLSGWDIRLLKIAAQDSRDSQIQRLRATDGF